MALTDHIDDLATAVATEVKKLHTAVDGNTGTGTGGLNTTATTLVGAINEVKITADAAAGGGVAIDDGSVRADATWSSEKIDEELSAVSVDLTELIDDVTASSSTVYSSTKVESELSGKANSSHTHTASQVTDFQSAVDARVTAGIANWVDEAPETLDTISEIAAAIENNQDAIDTLQTIGAESVRFTSQTLNGTQQTQARTNIGAASATALNDLSTDVGDVDSADFVAIFNAGLD